MSYAIWIALAVVLIAIGPALVRNMRQAGKSGSSADTTGATAATTSNHNCGDAADGAYSCDADADGGGGGGGGDCGGGD